MFTPKQHQNGADVPVATHRSPEPGPDYTGTIEGLKGRAMAVGAYRFGQQAHDQIFITPFGTGVSGGNYGDPGPSMWEWDDGLAIDELRGEP